MRKYAVSVLAGLLVFGAVAAGCGGGGQSKLKADEFADKTCPDLATWAQTLTDVFSELQGLSNVTDDETVKQKLSSALGDLDRATAKLASSIDDRGAPDVENGDQIKKQMVDALNSFRDSARKLRTQVDNFDVANADAADSESFSSALESFGSAADEDGASLDAFSDNSDLTNAFSDSKICEKAESEFSDFSS
jgi:hypothetical protein